MQVLYDIPQYAYPGRNTCCHVRDYGNEIRNQPPGKNRDTIRQRMPLNTRMEIKLFSMGKIFCSFLFTLAVNVLTPHSGWTQQIDTTRITLQLKDLSLKEAIRQIESLTPFTFLARAEDIEHEMHVTVNENDQPLDKV